jgi:hypothetical protein
MVAALRKDERWTLQYSETNSNLVKERMIMATDENGGLIQDREQHVSTEGVAGDSGQKHITPNPNLGCEAVPASKRNSDIETERD